MKHSRLNSALSKGFVLVVTLSLMVLLTVIAVGLLTLSVVSLRGGSREQSQSEARANARLTEAKIRNGVLVHQGRVLTSERLHEIISMWCMLPMMATRRFPARPTSGKLPEREEVGRADPARSAHFIPE